MYYRWKDRRIVVKVAVWGAEEGTAAPFVHTLADAVAERVDAGELETPETEGAVGLPHNSQAVTVDETDRKFTMFLCHPSGEAGHFADTPVDYKLVAPEAPVSGNRAFESALRGASGLVLLASGDEGADFAALKAAAERFGDPDEGDPGCVLRVLLAPSGSDKPDPEAFERTHDLPAETVVSAARPWNADDAWREVLGLTDQIRPLLERASRDGALPV